ncbi:SET domain-containing protein [Patescibacteria group bacterium]|nr:SET domain-containing protein [Patescibacteria group bacterium]
MKHIAPNITRKRLIFEGIYDKSFNVSIQSIKKYLNELSNVLGMTIIFGPISNNWAERKFPERYDGCEAWVMWAESGTQLYLWETPKRLITVDIYTCSDFSIHNALQFTTNYFQCCDYEFDVLPRKADNSKVFFQKNQKGIGIYTNTDISKGEFIGGFYGDIYTSSKASSLPEGIRDRALPFAKNKWRMSEGVVNNINHSCEPNCGVKDLFDIVAMRNIKAGEELTIDYAMAEDSDWEIPSGECLCGSDKCRGKVGTYSQLSETKKQEYKGFISEWLL